MNSHLRIIEFSVILCCLFLSAANAQIFRGTIDTLPNIYSTAINSVDPVTASPYSGLIFFTHRGMPSYAGSSGAIVYNYSSDNGHTWHRRLPAINASTITEGRYPSSALVADSSGNIDSSKGYVFYTQINSASAYGIGEVTDIDGGVSNALLMSEAEPASVCWSNSKTGWFYYVTYNSQGTYLFNRLKNINQVETFEMLGYSSFSHIIPIAGDASAGRLVFGFLGLKPNTSGLSAYLPGYVESYDNGATWSEIKWVDWRAAVGGSRYDQLWDYKPGDQYINLSADMVLDYRGLVHFAIGLTDTNVTPGNGRNSVAELWQTGSYWSLLTVKTNLTDRTFEMFDGPAAGQMGYAVNIAADRLMGVYAISYVNPPGIQDTLCDIFMSVRVENTGFFSPFFLTSTSGKNENSAHLSPVISYNPDHYSFNAHLIYNYPAGYSGHFPNGQGLDTQPNTVYYVNFDIPIPLSPVEFSEFNAESGSGYNLLTWTTASEKNNMQFVIERKSRVSDFLNIGIVKGSGTVTQPTQYSFYDPDPLPYAVYRIKQVDYNGEFSYSGETEVVNSYLSDFTILGNFPNPFNPQTTVSFTTESPGDLKFELFSITGELVDQRLISIANGGGHRIEVSGERLASGTYFYRLNFRGKSLRGKMVLLR